MALAAPGAPALAADDTDPQIAPCIEAVGTFLTKRDIKAEGKPDTVMRSLLSLTNGGHAFFTDSSEGGVLGYQPFSDGRGAWRCDSTANGSVRMPALIVDFTSPTTTDSDAKIARLDISAEISTDAGTISGKTTVRFVPLDGNPMDEAALGDPIEYLFSGMKIAMPE